MRGRVHGPHSGRPGWCVTDSCFSSEENPGLCVTPLPASRPGLLLSEEKSASLAPPEQAGLCVTPAAAAQNPAVSAVAARRWPPRPVRDIPPLAVTPGPPPAPWRSPTAPAPPSKWSAMVAAPRAPASAPRRFLASPPRDSPPGREGLHCSSLAAGSGTALAALDPQPETALHRQLCAPCIAAGAVPPGIHPNTSSGSSLLTPSAETTARIRHSAGSDSSSWGASPMAIRERPRIHIATLTIKTPDGLPTRWIQSRSGRGSQSGHR